jgi:hypothetical protein
MCELLFTLYNAYICAPASWHDATPTCYSQSASICRIGNATTIHGIIYDAGKPTALYSRVDTATMTITESFRGDIMNNDDKHVVTEDGVVYSLRVDRTRGEAVVTMGEYGTQVMTVDKGTTLSLVNSSPGGGVFLASDAVNVWRLTRVDVPVPFTYAFHERALYNTFMRDNTTAVIDSDDGARLIDLRQPRSVGLPFGSIITGAFVTENVIADIGDDIDACLFETLYDIRAGGSVILEALIDDDDYCAGMIA